MTFNGMIKEMFEDFHWGKFASSVAVGALSGGAYSMFDQAILHKNDRKNELPLENDYLKRTAPDIVMTMGQFYKYRNNVPTKRHKEAFVQFANKVLKESEYVSACYIKAMSIDDILEPNMDIIALYSKMQDHIRIIINYLRSMLALIDKDEDIDVEHSFNSLYECFNNRMYNVQSRFRS